MSMDRQYNREAYNISERLAVVESVVADLKATQSETNKKLDELLALRNRGMGAFWLITALLGTGILGFITSAISLLKGH